MYYFKSKLTPISKYPWCNTTNHCLMRCASGLGSCDAQKQSCKLIFALSRRRKCVVRDEAERKPTLINSGVHWMWRGACAHHATRLLYSCLFIFNVCFILGNKELAKLMRRYLKQGTKTNQATGRSGQSFCRK